MLRMYRRKLLLLTVLAAMALAISGCGGSGLSGSGDSGPTDYPTKPITIIVWSEPGSGTDVMARQAAPFMEEELGQPVEVENITGSATAAAQQRILSAPEDGHTIGVNTRSQMVALQTDLEDSFNLDQFEFIAEMQGDPYVLAVRTDSGLKDMDDFVEAVETNDRFSVGGFGPISAHRLFMAQIAQQRGFKNPQYVPFEGGSDATTNLLGGQIDAALTNVAQVLPQVQSGDFRVLGVSTPERLEQLPDTPTFKELGFDEQLTVTHWRGFYAKADTPPEVIEKLDQTFTKLSKDEKWKKHLKENALTNDFVGHDRWPEMVREDYKEVGEQLETAEF